jgi:stage II sporulation protein D
MLACMPAVTVKADSDIVIRIGLTRLGGTSVALTNKSIAVGFEKDGVFAAAATVTGASLGASPATGHYSRVSASSYADALTKASAIGLSAAPCVSAAGAWSALAPDPAGAPVSALIAITDGTSALLFAEGAVQIAEPDGGKIGAGSLSYRGRLEFGRAVVVNVIPMEEYLRGVVPAEMPAEWHIEALKAQALAARTYTRYNLEKHLSDGYDLCDDVHCQAYRGAGWEHPNSDAAVAATSGQCVYYRDRLIQAVFFASSGGRTENSEDVWGFEFDYLRSVPEIAETDPKQWSRTFTREQLTDIVRANGGDIGPVSGVAVTKTDAAGRVGELTIYGALGTHSLTREQIRAYFAPSDDGSLDSRNFTVASGGAPPRVYVYSGVQAAAFDLPSLAVYGAGSGITSVSALGANGASAAYAPVLDGAVTITGSGWGHAVGMSQCGADGMARLGYGYEEIIKYYYTGVSVK